MTAVLEVSTKELYIPYAYRSSIPSLCLPDADMLTSRLYAYSPSSSSSRPSLYPMATGPSTPSHAPNSSSGNIASNAVGSAGTIKTVKHKGCFMLSAAQRDAAKCMHEVLSSHLQATANMALDVHRSHLAARAREDSAAVSKRDAASCAGKDDAAARADTQLLLDRNNEVPRQEAALLSPFSASIASPAQPQQADMDHSDTSSPPNAVSLLSLYAKIISDAHDEPSCYTGSAPSNAPHKAASLFAYGGVQSGQTAPSQRAVCLHRDHFSEADEDAFMVSFLQTQIFSEYANTVSSSNCSSQHGDA